MLKISLAVITALILTACASHGGGGGAAQVSNKALDPSHSVRLTEMRTQFQDMLAKLDTNFDGLISEEEYCIVAGDNPLSPAYKKRQAEFREMVGKMDVDKDGTICLADYMSESNPLHPFHKR